MLPAGARTQLFSECAPFVRKRRVRGPSDVAGRLRNACRSCPGGSLRAIRPRFGIPDNTRRRTHAAHVLHGKNGLSGFWRKNFRNPDPPENGLPCRNFTVRRVVSRLPARSVSGCRRSLPLPGSSRRSGRGVPCRMPESDRYSLGRRRRSPHGFSGGKTQPFGA